MTRCDTPIAARIGRILGVRVAALLFSACNPWLAIFSSTMADAQSFDVEPHREAGAAPGVPSISFIESPTAACYGPLSAINACYIQWSGLSVSATSPQYIERMTVSIDGRIRAFYSGFFQTSMYVPPEMHSEGFRVACGTVGASGDPDSGFHYAYEIRARETGGQSTANYGTAICPADYRLDLIFRDGFE